eukprot:gene2653-2952_t
MTMSDVVPSDLPSWLLLDGCPAADSSSRSSFTQPAAATAHRTMRGRPWTTPIRPPKPQVPSPGSGIRKVADNVVEAAVDAGLTVSGPSDQVVSSPSYLCILNNETKRDALVQSTGKTLYVFDLAAYNANGQRIGWWNCLEKP